MQIHRILVEKTVEDRILELQDKKREVIEGALDEHAASQISRLGVRELKFLFVSPLVALTLLYEQLLTRIVECAVETPSPCLSLALLVSIFNSCLIFTTPRGIFSVLPMSRGATVLHLDLVDTPRRTKRRRIMVWYGLLQNGTGVNFLSLFISFFLSVC